MSPERRKVRLTELISRMMACKDIAPRDLENILTPEEFSHLQSQWASQLDMRDYVKDKPAAVTEYEDIIRQGQFLFNRSEGYSTGTKRSHRRDRNGVRYAKKFSDQSQAVFERALEHLSEASDIDPSLQVWFDRPLEFGPDGNIDLSPERMPKVVTSRSVDRQGDGILHSVQRKRELKQQTLQDALAALQAPVDHHDQAAATVANIRAVLRRQR